MRNFLRTCIIPVIVVAAFGLLTLLNSCQKQKITYTTTSDVNILGYIEQSPDKFSLFDQILIKTGYDGFLNTYGTYTCFVPTNAGVTTYLKSINKTTVADVDVNVLKGLVKLCLINDTIATQQFTDGKMRTASLSGQYLITGAASVNGVSLTTINKQANLVTGNVRLGNGIVHIIDNVLVPASLTLAKMVENDTRYSIFTQVLKATGFYDTLNVDAASATNPNRKFFTLIAQTDSVFNAAGFANYAAVAAKYSTKGNPKDHTDSLYLFAAYRIIPELDYLADIISASSHTTLAPLEVITDQLVGTTILLNNDTFNGVLEPGQPLDRPKSDNSATNGVLHSVTKNFKIKVRSPAPVYFDLGDQPETRKLTSIFRKAGKNNVFSLGQLANVTWNAGTVTYTVEASTTANFYYWDDHMDLSALRTAAGTMNYVDYTTPTIIKGRYKVWVDWRSSSGGVNIQAQFDGAALVNIINFQENLASANSDALLLSQGYKRYSEAPATNNKMVSKLVGIVDVPTTDRHHIKFVAIGNTSGAVTMDMVEFRPIDMDQNYPQFKRDGTLIPHP